MQLVFFETPWFTRLLPSYLGDEQYRQLQQALLERPERGALMPGTGGFRKPRWQDARRGKGRRGGLRVVYYHIAAAQQIWLFTLYDKDETEGLTATECRLLRNAVRAELQARAKAT